MLAPQDIKDFVAQLDTIEVTGDRTQKQLEVAMLILEHIAELAAKGRIRILEKV